MPAWNLSDDLADLRGPHCVAYPVCYPFDDAPSSAVSVTSVALERDAYDVPKLRIELSGAAQIYAMFPGRMSVTPTGLRLDTELFTMLTLDIRSVIGSDACWFRQWLETQVGTIPQVVHLEGATTTMSPFGDVEPGDPIGQLAADTPLLLSFEYESAATPTAPVRHPNPVEILSLLFWRELHDPLLNTAPPLAVHPLVRAMMSRTDDGTDTPEALGNYPGWLGLRPPLRTSKRFEWEARHTHWLSHDNWQREGSLTYVLRNPLALNAAGHAGAAAGSSKCNIILGDTAFRAGFRTSISGGAHGTSSPPAAPPLTYVSASSFHLPCNSDDCDGDLVVIGSGGRVAWRGRTFHRTLPFARRLHVEPGGDDARDINLWIADEGRVVVYARDQFCLRRTGASVPGSAREENSGGPSAPRCHGGLPPGPDPVHDRAGWIAAHQAEVDAAVAARVAAGATPGTALTNTVVDTLLAASPWANYIGANRNDTFDYEYKMFHVFAISHLEGILANGLAGGSRGFDQHCIPGPGPGFATTYDAVAWTGCIDETHRTFLELIAGGDPSEEWGILDLNCLTES